MPTYAIGDIQGCFDEFQALLELIQFDPAHDHLWVAGDLVNRGSKSLAVLRAIKNLNAVVVLGNHDFHLLAITYGHSYGKHTMQDILTAPDRDELIDWLRRQPLLHYDAKLDYLLVHAGLLPQWSLEQAQQYAKEVETVLASDRCAEFLTHLYGNTPTQWDPNLGSWDRLRFITNVFTRIRFCDTEGHLDLTSKGKLDSQLPGFSPWFKLPSHLPPDIKIVFGHWAALEGKTDTPHRYAIDTGCVWGRSLTALRLEDEQLFSVPCLI